MQRSLDPSACLAATWFVDADAPSIRALVDRLDLPNDQTGRAQHLFAYVRDEVTYAFRAKPLRGDYRASAILAEGEGFCVQKAIVLAAMGRAAGIPTALVFCDMIDQTLPDYIVDLIGGRRLYHHGINAFYLEGAWRLVDASLSPDVMSRKRYRPVEFDGLQDALLSSTTLDGTPHATYTAWRGLFADFDLDEMLRTFRTEYPRTEIAGMHTLPY